MNKFILIAVICLCPVFSFAQTNSPVGVLPRLSDNPRTEPEKIRAALEITAVGWNEGSLEKYLSVYAKDATEMRSTGPAGGVEAIEETMKKGFWKAGRPVQNLRFEKVVIRMMGSKTRS